AGQRGNVPGGHRGLRSEVGEMVSQSPVGVGHVDRVLGRPALDLLLGLAVAGEDVGIVTVAVLVHHAHQVIDDLDRLHGWSPGWGSIVDGDGHDAPLPVAAFVVVDVGELGARLFQPLDVPGLDDQDTAVVHD